MSRELYGQLLTQLSPDTLARVLAELLNVDYPDSQLTIAMMVAAEIGVACAGDEFLEDVRKYEQELDKVRSNRS